MTSNVGLTTPRGSGTSGYVQRNLSVLRPRDSGFGAPYPPWQGQGQGQQQPPRQRQADQEILAHDREREIEVKVLEFRDRLEEEAEGKGVLDEEEIDRRCDELRRRLLKMDEEEGAGMGGGAKRGGGKGLKPHQVHELAEAKIKETERLRKALGIKEQNTTTDGGGLTRTAEAAQEDRIKGEMRRSGRVDRIMRT